MVCAPSLCLPPMSFFLSSSRNFAISVCACFQEETGVLHTHTHTHAPLFPSTSTCLSTLLICLNHHLTTQTHTHQLHTRAVFTSLYSCSVCLHSNSAVRCSDLSVCVLICAGPPVWYTVAVLSDPCRSSCVVYCSCVV